MVFRQLDPPLEFRGSVILAIMIQPPPDESDVTVIFGINTPTLKIKDQGGCGLWVVGAINKSEVHKTPNSLRFVVEVSPYFL